MPKCICTILSATESIHDNVKLSVGWSAPRPDRTRKSLLDAQLTLTAGAWWRTHVGQRDRVVVRPRHAAVAPVEQLVGPHQPADGVGQPVVSLWRASFCQRSHWDGWIAASPQKSKRLCRIVERTCAAVPHVVKAAVPHKLQAAEPRALCDSRRNS